MRNDRYKREAITSSHVPLPTNFLGPALLELGNFASMPYLATYVRRKTSDEDGH
jgi:hypothetical protein